MLSEKVFQKNHPDFKGVKFKTTFKTTFLTQIKTVPTIIGYKIKTGGNPNSSISTVIYLY